MSERGRQVNVNGVRALLVVAGVLLLGVPALRAQDSEPSAASLDRIRAALQNPSPLFNGVVPSFTPGRPESVRMGMFTFLPPDTPGEVVNVGVPVGELVMRAVHFISAARHRRAENAARKEVAQALADFFAAQPK